MRVTLDTNVYVSAFEFQGMGEDDPDDNRIVECAVEAGSAYIVTKDKDLLRMGEYGGIKMIRPADFLKRVMDR